MNDKSIFFFLARHTDGAAWRRWLSSKGRHQEAKDEEDGEEVGGESERKSFTRLLHSMSNDRADNKTVTTYANKRIQAEESSPQRKKILKHEFNVGLPYF